MNESEINELTEKWLNHILHMTVSQDFDIISGKNEKPFLEYIQTLCKDATAEKITDAMINIRCYGINDIGFDVVAVLNNDVDNHCTIMSDSLNNDNAIRTLLRNSLLAGAILS